MISKRFAALGLASVMAASIATVPVPGAASPRPPAAAPAEAAASAHDRLFKLFKDSDEANLKRNPLSALFRGDLRYADQLGDNITDEYYAGGTRRRRGRAGRACTRSTATRSTPPTSWPTTCSNFRPRTRCKNLTPEMLALTAVRPLNHFFGFHTFYPTLASGKGTAPFKTVADYDNNLKRHTQFVTLIDRSVGRFREGMASGVVETKMTIRNVIEQLDTQLKQKPEESPYYGPVKQFPASFSAADKARLTDRLSRLDHDRALSRADPPARFPEDRLSAQGARRRGPDVHEGRRRRCTAS